MMLGLFLTLTTLSEFQAIRAYPNLYETEIFGHEMKEMNLDYRLITDSQ